VRIKWLLIASQKALYLPGHEIFSDSSEKAEESRMRSITRSAKRPTKVTGERFVTAR